MDPMMGGLVYRTVTTMTRKLASQRLSFSSLELLTKKALTMSKMFVNQFKSQLQVYPVKSRGPKN